MFRFDVGRHLYLATPDSEFSLEEVTQPVPADINDLIKCYDHVLHRSLGKIFRKRRLGTTDQIKGFLRGLKHDDQKSITKKILKLEPALSRHFSQTELQQVSLMWIAVLAGYEKSAELLIRSGVDVNELFGRHAPQVVDETWTVLHVLVQMRPSPENERLIRLVMDHGADLQARDHRERTVLHYAVKEGRVQMTETLLKNGADVNAADDEGMTPLLVAVCNSQDELVSLFLIHGADLQARDHKGQTALYYAVREGRVQMTETLLENGADVNAADNEGMTPLFIAVGKKEANQLVPLLMKHGANVFATNKDGKGVLQHLVSLDAVEDVTDLARVFIKKGVSLPIQLAAYRGNNELVKLFLDYGANVNSVDFAIFPLYYAVIRENNVAVLETLLKRGANVNQTVIANNGTSLGSTALHAACEYFREEHIRLLLSAGAYVHTTNHCGKTPLAILLSSENQENSSSVRSIIEVLALKKVSEPTIELTDENLIRMYPLLWKHYRDCIEQIEQRMKSTRFIETCTFYELLTKCHCQIAVLMRNPNFETKFRMYDLSGFSIHYAEVMTRAFERAQNHYHFMLEQEEVINEAVYYKKKLSNVYSLQQFFCIFINIR